MHGIEHAPTLRNYLERQTYTVREAPAGYEQQLKDSKLGDPVLVVPPDFEADLARGKAPVVELVASATNQRSQTGSGPLVRLLRGFNQEQATLRLAVRGVSPAALEAAAHRGARPGRPGQPRRAAGRPWCRSSCSWRCSTAR